MAQILIVSFCPQDIDIQGNHIISKVTNQQHFSKIYTLFAKLTVLFNVKRYFQPI